MKDGKPEATSIEKVFDCRDLDNVQVHWDDIPSYHGPECVHKWTVHEEASNACGGIVYWCEHCGAFKA